MIILTIHDWVKRSTAFVYVEICRCTEYLLLQMLYWDLLHVTFYCDISLCYYWEFWDYLPSNYLLCVNRSSQWRPSILLQHGCFCHYKLTGKYDKRDLVGTFNSLIISFVLYKTIKLTIGKVNEILATNQQVFCGSRSQLFKWSLKTQFMNIKYNSYQLRMPLFPMLNH